MAKAGRPKLDRPAGPEGYYPVQIPERLRAEVDRIKAREATGMSLKHIVAVALHHWSSVGKDDRDRMLRAYDRWIDSAAKRSGD